MTAPNHISRFPKGWVEARKDHVRVVNDLVALVRMPDNPVKDEFLAIVERHIKPERPLGPTEKSQDIR